MPTCSFTLPFKNKVQILSNSSLLSDIFKACIRTKPFQNIKSLKKHSIHGNKVQITLSVKQKIPKNKLNDAVKNVIHLLKKKKYQFKSTKTMKGGGKKNRRSTRKTRKQKGGQLKGKRKNTDTEEDVKKGQSIAIDIVPSEIIDTNTPFGNNPDDYKKVPTKYHFYTYQGTIQKTDEAGYITKQVKLKSTSKSSIQYIDNFKNITTEKILTPEIVTFIDKNKIKPGTIEIL